MYNICINNLLDCVCEVGDNDACLNMLQIEKNKECFHCIVISMKHIQILL